MNKSLIVVLTVLSTAVSAAAAAQSNTIQAPRLSGELSYTVQGNPDPSSLGPMEGSIGFKSLPATMLQSRQDTNKISTVHPVCLTKGAANRGWLGIALLRGKNLSCMTAKGESALFWTLSSKPNQPVIWMNTSSAQPEPRSTVVVATQHDPPRPMRPCKSNQPAQAFAGYIGDDGMCHGRTTSNGPISATSYMVPVSQATGPGAQPFQGWAPAASSFIPHGALKVTTPDKIADLAVSGPRAALTLCRVQAGGVSWPGWIKGTSCHAFTYANNKTSNIQSSTFAVFRTAPFQEGSSPPYVFNSTGGKPFYACVAWADNRATPLWGFTNNPSACTNGSQTSTKNVKLVRLPAAQGDRA